MIEVDVRNGQELSEDDIHRSGALPREIAQAAEAIVAEVRAKGDEALRAYSTKYDGVCPEVLRVPREVIEAAPSQVDPEFLDALTQAYTQIRAFHEREILQSMFTTRLDGTLLGVKVTPLPSVGIYIPGGRAQYPSTVLMNAIPAQVAGVSRIVMMTPPQCDGTLSAYTLCAAHLAGVDEVYAVGGAQAIAALAYGTASIPRVAKITGPGNAYVAAAKRCVMGDVGIDMVAGPSEVCVLADASADPVIVAADLMAQAEHDPLATCYLVTDCDELPKQVVQALERLAAQSPRAEITRQSLEHGVMVRCATMRQAIAAVNVVAPEHLELHCADAWNLVGSIEHAGAIFVGPWSSEPLGDYVAGPNHTLPTGGTAKFSNPLGVYDFVKRSTIVAYTPAGLVADGPAVQTLAQSEGLWAHALSVGLRLKLAASGADRFDDTSAATADAFTVAWPHQLNKPVASKVNVPTTTTSEE